MKRIASIFALMSLEVGRLRMERVAVESHRKPSRYWVNVKNSRYTN